MLANRTPGGTPTDARDPRQPRARHRGRSRRRCRRVRKSRVELGSAISGHTIALGDITGIDSPIRGAIGIRRLVDAQAFREARLAVDGADA